MKIGLVAGVHEDIVNLKRALAILKGKACDKIVCLGDIVGYSVPYFGYLSSRDAHLAIQLVRKECAYVVAGNHDCFHARKKPQHSEFNYSDDWYELELLDQKRLSQGKVFTYEEELPAEIDDDDREYLQNLPEYAIIENAGLGILASHYVYPNLVGDQVEFDPVDHGIGEHLQFMLEKGVNIGVFSHDLVEGARVFTPTEVSSLSFGKHNLPAPPFVIGTPWVANGTEPNGFTILHAEEGAIEVIPLGAKPHKVPKWAHR